MGHNPATTVNQNRQQVGQEAQNAYTNLQSGPTGNEQWMRDVAQGGQNRYNVAADQATQDYSNQMGQYQGWTSGAADFANQLRNNLNPSFSYQTVNPTHVSYTEDPRLTSAGVGYQNFADTGGYSQQDIADLRARGMAPITAAYGNTMANLERAKALGGGYAPNYIAAVASAQRTMPQQLSDAEQGVNAQLAEDIRSGKLQGLQGLTGIGTEVGKEQLGAAEANQGVDLQSAISNQQANLRAQELTEQGYDARTAQAIAAQESTLRGITGQTQLYGTTPAQASMFGNLAMQGYGNVINMDQMRNNYGLGLLNTEIGANQNPADQGTPWWRKALGAAAAGAATYFTGGAAAPLAGSIYGAVSSDENLKENIRPAGVHDVTKGLKNLKIDKWNYKGDNTTHIGPMAQEFKRKFGVGDGKTLHLADVMGVLLASRKAELAHA